MTSPVPTLTPEVQEKICTAIRCGAIYETACATAGVKRETFRMWLRRGRTGKSKLYIDFVDEIDRALADSEVHCLAIIRAAASDDWKAAAWLLERRWPERYGRRWKIVGEEVDPEAQGDPDFESMSEEQLEAAIDAIAAAVAGRSPVVAASDNGA